MSSTTLRARLRDLGMVRSVRGGNDLTGRRFGRLRVVGRVPPLRSPFLYECVCDCGRSHVVRGRVLTRSRHPVRSCGCRRSPRGPEAGHWRGFGEIDGTFWGTVVHNAAARGIPVELTIEQAWEQFLRQGRRCALTGVPLVMLAEGRTASLDRVDSSRGYVPGNVQWVLRRVNQMKWNLPQEDFVRLCRLVAACHPEVVNHG